MGLSTSYDEPHSTGAFSSWQGTFRGRPLAFASDDYLVLAVLGNGEDELGYESAGRVPVVCRSPILDIKLIMAKADKHLWEGAVGGSNPSYANMCATVPGD